MPQNLAEIIDTAYNVFTMGQNRQEILELAEFVAGLNCQNILEIGSGAGGTLYIWRNLASGEVVSIDIDHAGQRVFNDERYPAPVQLITASSQDMSTFAQIKDKVFDFIFIDGDHSYEGVKKDYMLYQGLCKPGGYIAFHDINDNWYMQQNNCQVKKFWDELRGEKFEINYHTNWVPNADYTLGGIGVIRNV